MCEYHEWRKANDDVLSYRYYCPHCFTLAQWVNGVLLILGRI